RPRPPGPSRLPFRPRPGHRAHRPPGGAPMTAFFTVLVTALFAVAGLVVDYGSALQTKREAIDEARHAALAGAAQTSFAALRAGQYRIDPQRAETAGRRFLDEVGAVGTVDATPEVVTVRVTAQRDTAFL